MSSYYREKLLKLHDKLFLSSLSARDKFIQIESYFDTAYLASKTIDDEIIRRKWEQIWKELNQFEGRSYRNFEVSSFAVTVSKKWNRTLEKYLHFILEEYYRVL